LIPTRHVSRECAARTAERKPSAPTSSAPQTSPPILSPARKIAAELRAVRYFTVCRGAPLGFVDDASRRRSE
jgi:hypothetical protein